MTTMNASKLLTLCVAEIDAANATSEELWGAYPQVRTLADTAFDALVFFKAGWPFYPDGDVRGMFLESICEETFDGVCGIEDSNFRFPLIEAADAVFSAIESNVTKIGGRMNLDMMDALRAVRNVVRYKAYELSMGMLSNEDAYEARCALSSSGSLTVAA